MDSACQICNLVHIELAKSKAPAAQRFAWTKSSDKTVNTTSKCAVWLRIPSSPLLKASPQYTCVFSHGDRITQYIFTASIEGSKLLSWDQQHSNTMWGPRSTNFRHMRLQPHAAKHSSRVAWEKIRLELEQESEVTVKTIESAFATVNTGSGTFQRLG
ncbi:hypothetical protein L596_021885 [Steinernema carpocapsae]|uniref:Uncharacterized protein n=1 Tax=Steinernema carpocapsae TaxID=34508 RepID=A0A4U5MK37_STECR|nr:hypothetical protein L596_021885 [Steinernema carpocapsae]